MTAGEPLPVLLVSFRGDLAGYVARHAGRILRYETAEDLVQGVHVRALESATTFQYRGRERFLAWLHAVARSHLADRHEYWAALRRRPSRLVRLGTAAGTDDRASGGAPEHAATSTGPSTLASRREQIELAVLVLAALPPRDRDLVRWTCEDVDPAEQAQRLGLSHEAVDRARRRALERFRKAFELAQRR